MCSPPVHIKGWKTFFATITISKDLLYLQDNPAVRRTQIDAMLTAGRPTFVAAFVVSSMPLVVPTMITVVVPTMITVVVPTMTNVCPDKARCWHS